MAKIMLWPSMIQIRPLPIAAPGRTSRFRRSDGAPAPRWGPGTVTRFGPLPADRRRRADAITQVSPHGLTEWPDGLVDWVVNRSLSQRGRLVAGRQGEE